MFSWFLPPVKGLKSFSTGGKGWKIPRLGEVWKIFRRGGNFVGVGGGGQYISVLHVLNSRETFPETGKQDSFIEKLKGIVNMYESLRSQEHELKQDEF